MGQSHRKQRILPDPVGVEAFIPPPIVVDDLNHISSDEDLYFELARRSGCRKFLLGNFLNFC